MGTNNFYYRNASRCFAAMENYEQPILDDDGNETDDVEYISPDEWEYDDFIINLQSDFKNLKGYYFVSNRGTDEHELRSFPSKVIGTLTKTKTYVKNIDVDVEIIIVSRSGYYEGVCLDYNVRFMLAGDECDNIEGFASDIEYYGDLTEKRAEYLSKVVWKWCEKTQEEMEHLVEKIFAEHTTSYECLGSASNGETFYKKMTQ